MLFLAINTATKETAIALLEKSGADAQVLAEENWESSNDEAEKLMPTLDRLLSTSGKSYGDIYNVLVVKGPGSFTGLRIGVTVANTIAYLNNCKLSSIDTFELLWQAAKSQGIIAEPHTTALLVFAGNGGAYLDLPDKDPQLIDLPELSTRLKELKITSAFGTITTEQLQAITEIGYHDLKVDFAKTMMEIIKTEQPYEKLVKPLYIKEPGITKSKKTIF